MRAGDLWVWLAFALFLGLLGARAWTVETGEGPRGRTPAKVRALTVACGAALATLVTLVAVQGGAELVGLLLSPGDAPSVAPADPADPGDPAAPPG